MAEACAYARVIEESASFAFRGTVRWTNRTRQLSSQHSLQHRFDCDVALLWRLGYKHVNESTYEVRIPTEAL